MHTTFPEVYELERFRTAKVTFNAHQSHWQWCYWKSRISYDIPTIFLFFILHRFRDIVSYLPEFKEVT